jgi:hypothetical protein
VHLQNLWDYHDIEEAAQCRHTSPAPEYGTTVAPNAYPRIELNSSA